MLRAHETQIRVRYPETDPMGVVHHAQYLSYFEIGRTELVRASGDSYRAWEEAGLMVVVVKAELRYRKPARYDDLLTVRTHIDRVTHARIEHSYQILRGDELLVEGKVTLATIDRDGNLRRVPDHLRDPEPFDQ